MALTLEEFTRTVDPKSLPRVLQIQCGIYSPGSVYEMHGRECCLSTGEMLKVIGISVSALTAEIQQKGSDTLTVNVPLDYPGLFQIVADKRPYLSIREIVESLRIGPECLGRHVFRCARNLPLTDGTLQAGECFTVVSLQSGSGEGRVECETKAGKRCLALQLSQHGEFYECEDDQFYTLKEIVEWKMPKGRKRVVHLAKALLKKDVCFRELPLNYSRELILSPVYELQAVMKFRNDVVYIPSNLDVEVIEVMEPWESDCFLQPLSLSNVFKKPSEEFPFMAEIIEFPLNVPSELMDLLRCKQIIIHRASEAKRILASEIRSGTQRRFLVPLSYKGRFKRKPREFPTAYDLEVAKRDKEQLHVVATRAFQSRYEGLSSVLVGDQYLVRGKETSEVVYGETRKTVEALACEKIEGKNYESVLIPMCHNGGFVEVIHDKKQYSLLEVCQKFHFPFNVKVSVRDLSVPVDVLAATLGLHLEEEITDQYLLISNMDMSECWEIPVKRTQMSLHLLPQGPKPSPPPVERSAVEEIEEDCYYSLRRYATATVLPPPRPPKIPKQALPEPLRLQLPQPEKSVQLPSPKLQHVTAPKPAVLLSDCAGQCSDIPTPTTVVPPNRVLQKAINIGDCFGNAQDNDDDAHEYEYINEDELESIRRKFDEQKIHSNLKEGQRNAYEHSM